MFTFPHASNTLRAPARRVGAIALAVARETHALLVQSTLMHRDLLPSVPTDLGKNEPLVVVLHGLFATAGALRPLRHEIETSTGRRTASFSYEPGCDLPTLVERLRSLLKPLPPTCPIDLVGHSMGGIAARYYVQVGPGDRRVRRTISIASPFHGSNLARYVPSFFCRDLIPGSPSLRRLLQDHAHAAHVPHTSIASTHDQLVWPWRAALYPYGKHVIVASRAHNTLLFDPLVARHVTHALLDTARTSSPVTLSAPSDHGVATTHVRAYAFASNEWETA